MFLAFLIDQPTDTTADGVVDAGYTASADSQKLFRFRRCTS